MLYKNPDRTNTNESLVEHFQTKTMWVVNKLPVQNIHVHSNYIQVIHILYEITYAFQIVCYNRAIAAAKLPLYYFSVIADRPINK